ncbi:MAG: LysR family transcriptional regulator [Sneathiella sp.]
MVKSFDWSHLQSLVAVAEQGSLSKAARALGSSQPTMGRHISVLETQLGVNLFERTATGLELTDTGRVLLEHARQMSDAAHRLSLSAEGHSESIAGTIRITASEVVATYLLPDILTSFHQIEPEIEIELVASDQEENLLQREADIAVRMFRPTQSGVFTKKIGELTLGLYASHSYLKRRGTPNSLSDILNHDIIGYDRSEQIIQGFRAAGLEVGRHSFSFRSDNQVAAWRMVVAGYGIGFNQTAIGDTEPLVTRLDMKTALPTLPMWLTAHSELKTSPRVRRVFDFLADHLGQIP